MNLDAALTFVGNIRDVLRGHREPDLTPKQYEIVDTYDGLLIRQVGTALYLWEMLDTKAPEFSRRNKPPRGARRLYAVDNVEHGRRVIENVRARDANRIAYVKICQQQRQDRAAYVEKVIE